MAGDLTFVVAVEPVWYLPGVAARFGIDEGLLRRGLFEDTGGSYPELITRGDLKVFLPPIGTQLPQPMLTLFIGGLTAYIFGDVKNVSDPEKRLALRVHDVPALPRNRTTNRRNVTDLTSFPPIFVPVDLI